MLASYPQGNFKKLYTDATDVLVLFYCQVFFKSYTQLMQMF